MATERMPRWPRAERRTRGTSRRRAGLGPLVLVGAGVAFVLGAPVDVLTLVGPRTPAHGTDRTVPSGEDVASVRAPRTDATSTGAGTTTDGAPAGAPVGMSPDEGRWGAPADRPTRGTLHVEELRGGWRIAAGAEEAAALGVLMGHAWARGQLGMGQQETGRRGMGQGTDVGVGGSVVTLEAVERPGPSYAVVTVLVARGDDVQRLAVPVVFRDAGPVLAGAPWRLPSPATASMPVEGTAIGDEVLVAAARDALERVGIPGSRLERLEVTDGWPFIARLSDDADGHPWLRWHLDRFVVTGLPLDRAEEGP